MKKYLTVILLLMVISGIGWYVNENNNSKVQNKVRVRTSYQGYVQIEPTSMEAIIKWIEGVGCTPDSQSCHYIYDKEKNTLELNPYRKGNIPFGPAGGFKIINDRLYASFDIEGREDPEIFREAVMDEIKKYGNAVIPIETTWTITNTKDSTGRTY